MLSTPYWSLPICGVFTGLPPVVHEVSAMAVAPASINLEAAPFKCGRTCGLTRSTCLTLHGAVAQGRITKARSVWTKLLSMNEI